MVADEEVDDRLALAFCYCFFCLLLLLLLLEATIRRLSISIFFSLNSEEMETNMWKQQRKKVKLLLHDVTSRTHNWHLFQLDCLNSLPDFASLIASLLLWTRFVFDVDLRDYEIID